MHPLEVVLTPLGKAFRNRRSDESASIANSDGLATPNHFSVTSPSFADGQVIPARFCGWLIGDNISPALEWGTLPPRTADLVLLIEDLDSPGVVPRIHTIAVFEPNDVGLPEGALTADAPGIRFVPDHRGPGSYRGPRPLPGHGAHRYRFHVFAVDQHIDVEAISGASDLPAALTGHILASGLLTGTRTA
jgi:phosphatidylethanolamine-binding protein (PEBP) family uncharacterized protein